MAITSLSEDVIAIFFVYPLRNSPPLEGLGEAFYFTIIARAFS
jgi:hypothetical protein